MTLVLICILFPVGNKRPSKVQNKIYDRFSVTLVISDLIDLMILIVSLFGIIKIYLRLKIF